MLMRDVSVPLGYYIHCGIITIVSSHSPIQVEKSHAAAAAAKPIEGGGGGCCGGGD